MGAPFRSSVCQVYAEHAVEESTRRRWFRIFREGERSCQDQAISGSPSHHGEDYIYQAGWNNPNPTM